MVTADRTSVDTLTTFANTPLTDFTNEEHARAQREALRRVESELGTTFPLIIGGERRMTADTFASFNPARPDQVVARFAKAGPTEADQAIQAAWRTFRSWQYTPAAERAGYLFE